MTRGRGAASVAVLLLAAGLVDVTPLAASVGTPPASSAPADPAPPIFNWRFDGQAFLYDTNLARSPNSALNPGNAFARLPNFELNEELRPNARATSQYADVVFHPRLTSIFETGGVPERESVRGYFQEGYVRLKPTQDISLTFGRELMTWGPAFFRSPSNPFYFNNERINPIVELSGIDLVRASYSPGPAWTVTGGVVLDSGHDVVANNAYKNSLLLKADYQGPDYAGSLILSSIRGRSLFTGAYAQATIDDAVLAYGEFGASSAEQAVDTAPSALSPAEYASRRSATALAGASYTFGNGTSLYAEYLYNGFGFEGGGERRFIQQARQSGQDALLGGSLGGVALDNLGGAATRGQNLLGQHYVYVQYQNNPAEGSMLWRLMAAHNIADHSTQFSAYFERSVSDRLSLFALGVYNAGSPDAEFPALFRASATLGLKVFLF